MKQTIELLKHPIFTRLKTFDADAADTPAPVEAPAPPVTRPTRRLVPYSQIPMGVRGYRREASTRHCLTRGHENPRESIFGAESFWIDV